MRRGVLSACSRGFGRTELSLPVDHESTISLENRRIVILSRAKVSVLAQLGVIMLMCVAGLGAALAGVLGSWGPDR